MPLYVTVPVTPPLSVNVDVPIVVVSIASLKVAVIASLTSTPVAPFNGLVEMTVGAVVSGRVVVVVLVVVVELVVVLLVVVGTVVLVVVVVVLEVVVLDVVVVVVVGGGGGVEVINDVSLPYDVPKLFSAATL